MKLNGFMERGISQWIRVTGRRVTPSDAPWLAGPVGTGETIGPQFYEDYAAQAGLTLARNAAGSGLLPDFQSLACGSFHPDQVDLDIKRFYEKTVDYSLEVWSEWGGIFQPFAWLLISLVSRDIQQFNLPLSPLESSRGISSEIIRLTNGANGEVRYTGWLRQVRATGHILFAGFYTTCRPPGDESVCVKVVFPLPHGSVTVLLRPENRPDSSFLLVSAGRRFGEPGYYRMLQTRDDMLHVRYLPLKESIHVYKDETGNLRTDHLFHLFGLRFLSLHYKIARKPLV